MALVERLQISNRIAHLRRDVHTTPEQRKGVHPPADSLSVVETTRSRVSPRETWNSCLMRQLVQPDFCTSQGSFLESDTSCVKFPKPSLAPNVLHLAPEHKHRVLPESLVNDLSGETIFYHRISLFDARQLHGLDISASNFCPEEDFYLNNFSEASLV